MIDEQKLEEAISKQSGHPMMRPVHFIDIHGDNVAPMRDKVRTYARCYGRIMESPGMIGEIDYNFCVLEALKFIAQEREGTFKFGSDVFKEEYAHTPFLFLIHAAHAYIHNSNDVMRLIVGLFIEEMENLPPKTDPREQITEAPIPKGKRSVN